VTDPLDRRVEAIALLAILVVAALLRFVDLPTRGMWDADQGHDLLVLRELVRDGRVPLLGPPTSIGDFHHGALYYWLLAPAAFVSGADPLVVVAWIAAGGVAAVAVVWWLGRSIGGPVAGLVAAGLMAVSASAIEESTFVWNPNLIALTSAIALAAAWRAWATRDARWWVLAALGQTLTQHLHVLGWVMLVPIAALLVADARRRAPGDRRPVILAAVAWVALATASYLPLLASELQTGFAETAALVDYLTGGGGDGAAPLAVRLLVVPLRILSWPLTGLVTAQPVAAIAVAAAVIALVAWRARAAARPERDAARWLGGTLAWSGVALAIGAPSLASVVPDLPNDHYHAFLDPVVFVVVGLGAAALWRSARLAGRALVVAGTAVLVALNGSLWPPAVAPDGGYPAAERAAGRILTTLGSAPYRLASLPTLKVPDAYGLPLLRLGGRPAGNADDGAPLVIACDRVLESIIGAACGGAAEDAYLGKLAEADRTLTERFDASPRTVISIYR
jgi:Dolichyl-phosphate-mannose-protein mannosyltransferase